MNQIESEISQYEYQLAQVQSALSELAEGPERSSLCALESDLKELILLSKGSVSELETKTFNANKNDKLDEEYDLFKAELEKLNKKTESNTETLPKSDLLNSELANSSKNEKLMSEISNLQGMKCQAPFMYKWTDDVTYHNAFVSHVPDLDPCIKYGDIEVKVMFTNPTHKEMLPCPYYLQGDCKFTDEKCRYSHGELVLLSSLKEYREPEFSNLTPGCQVFAKQDDGLWYRAVVLDVGETHCLTKFESNSKEESIPLHNILPPNKLDLKEISKNSSSSDSESDLEVNTTEKDDNIVSRILSNPPNSKLGSWEKFTKGFGSKMMAKMGYVYGSGLGKNGLGRVEPVPATVFPPGKSLDHCIMLKNKAGNDHDLFKTERKMKRLHKKHEEKLKKAYEAEKEKSDVFDFLNTKLAPAKATESSKVEVKRNFKHETTQNLNVTHLKLTEEMRKVEKEIKSLNQALTRHKPNSLTFNIIKDKLALQETALLQLNTSEKNLMREQDQRRDRQKLTIF